MVLLHLINFFFFSRGPLLSQPKLDAPTPLSRLVLVQPGGVIDSDIDNWDGIIDNEGPASRRWPTPGRAGQGTQ